MRRLLLATVLGSYFALFSHAQAYPLVAACDANGDSVINSTDLSIFAQHFNEHGSVYDSNLDGVDNSADLAACSKVFNAWAYPEGDNPITFPPTTDTEGLSVEEATQTAQASGCPECTPAPTAPVPTP